MPRDINKKNISSDTGQGRFWPAVFVFLVAAAIRFIFLAQSYDSPTFHTPIIDAGTYDIVARNLIAGKEPADIFWQPPFYPLWLAAIYKTGGGIVSVKVLQLLIGSFTCVFVFLLGERFLGRKGGLLAGILSAFYMPMVYLEAELLPTVWECFWFVGLVLFCFVVKGEKSLTLALVFGLLSGLAAITRPNLIPVAVVWFLWLVWKWYKEQTGLRFFAMVACVIAGFALVALPIAAWSRMRLNRFSILPHSGGLNMYIGNNPDWQHTVTVRPGTEWRELTEMPLHHGINTKAGAEKWFYSQVREYIQKQPGSFIKGLGVKTIQFLSPREMPRNSDIYLYRQWSHLLRIGVWKLGHFGFPFGLLLPLAAVGAWSGRKSLPPVLWMAVGVYAASIILVFIAGRYRIPLVPILSIPAAAGLLSIVGMFKLKQWSRLAVASAMIIVIAAATSIAGPFPQEQYDYHSEMYFELGNSLRDRGRLNEAEKAYAKAVMLRDGYADAHADLAGLLKDRGDASEAVLHYESALAAGLDTGIVHAGLAESLIALNRYDEAISHLRRAIVLSEDPKVRNNLGNLLAMKGSHAEAIEQFERSLELEPGNARTMNNLANALAAVGRLYSAEQMYRKSIAADPKTAGTHYNLAVCLKLQGKNEAAEAELIETLRLDPNHAAARKALDSLKRNRQ